MKDLYIRDNSTGKVHRIGDNHHDCLWVDENGVVQYHNLQNGDGTKGSGYSFVKTDYYGYISEEDEAQAEEFRKNAEAWKEKRKELAKQGIIMS